MPKITRRKRLGRRPKRSKSPGVDTEVEGGVEVEGLDADADADADADVDAEGLDADADVDAVPIVADAVPINEEGGGEGGGGLVREQYVEREENSDAGISVVAMLSHQYPRRDDNWRSARAVRSRDNKLAKKNEQNKELKTINKSLHQRVRKLESTLKESEHNNYLERKAARTEAIQVEREHSGEIRRIQERHANELSQTHAEIEYAYAKAEWEESTRIAAEQVWKEKVREEKRLGAMALMKLRKMHRKEISGLRAVIAYLHKQQQNATILYKSKQDASIRDERTMISAMQKRIDAKSAQVLMLKEVISELNAKHDKEINEMELWMNEMTSEVTQAMRDKKSALAKVEYDRNIAAKRLQKWTMEKMLRRQAEDNLAKMEKEMKSVKHELEVANRLLAVNNFRKLEMKKEWSGLNATNKRSRRGGSRRWPVWVVQVICELLVSGTPPSAIPSNLLTLYMVLYNERPKNIPSVSFVRHCRIVIEVIGETLAAIKLANCPSWDQLWTDATTRQQIPFTALIIGVLTDNGGDTVIDPVVVSSCIFLEDETSESQAEGIKSKIKSLRHRLQRLIEFYSALHPGDEHNLPSTDEIDIQKLGYGGLITSDTCNQAQKVRRILVNHIAGSYDYDCMNHLRNVWFGGMEKALVKYLKAHLRTALEEIDPQLRVSASMSAIIRAVDKEFSLSANYPKGHGKQFLEWMREYHPGAVLLHVERASGSRQDLCTEGSMAIYMNYPYYVEFLDDMLKRSSGDDSTTKEKSILQRNLFVALTSQEMIALSRFLSIMHIAVCMPLRWLAGCTHKLGVYDWGPFSMGRAIDSLKDKMNLMVDDPSLILNKNWMMDMWKPFSNELPPFEKYLNETFNKRQMKVIARKSGANVVQYGLLREELFNPTRKSAAATYDRTLELARIAADAIISELLDETKATAKYLSIPDENGEYSEYSFKGASEEKKSMTLWKSATNDEAESVLGSATRNIQVYSRIHISGAGAVSSIKRNRFMDRSAIECEMKPLGLFHTLDEKMREAIILLALDDAIATRNQSNHDLQAQATERRRKSELLKSRDLMKATAEYVEAVCYHDLYSSPACWKGDATIVSRNIAQLTTQKSKYAALKTNILIRVKGFGWHWCRHPWSKNGRKYTVEELSAHLEYILREEKNYAIPRDPVVHVPMRVNLPFLGTPTEQVAELNEKSKGGELEIKRSAASIRRGMNRQRRGEKTIYQMCQPAVRPTLESLIGFRIDVLCKFSGNGASTNRDNNLDDCLIWCQGGVTRVINAKNKEVLVVWDNMHDESGKEVSYAPSSQRLLPSLWMKDVEGAWRMDIAVDVIGEGDDTTRTDLSGDDAIDISFDIDEELETDNIHDSKEVLDNSDIDDGSESECEYDSE